MQQENGNCEFKDGDKIKVTIEGTVCDAMSEGYIIFKLKSGKELAVQKDWLKQGVNVEPANEVIYKFNIGDKSKPRLDVGECSAIRRWLEHDTCQEESGFEIGCKVMTTEECLDRLQLQEDGVVFNVEGDIAYFINRKGRIFRLSRCWLKRDDRTTIESKHGSEIEAIEEIQDKGITCNMDWPQFNTGQDTIPENPYRMSLLLKNSAATLGREENYDEWNEKKTLRKEMDRLKEGSGEY